MDDRGVLPFQETSAYKPEKSKELGTYEIWCATKIALLGGENDDGPVEGMGYRVPYFQTKQNATV